MTYYEIKTLNRLKNMLVFTVTATFFWTACNIKMDSKHTVKIRLHVSGLNWLYESGVFSAHDCVIHSTEFSS